MPWLGCRIPLLHPSSNQHLLHFNIPNQNFTMPHITFPLQLASRFLSLRTLFQGLAHWVLVLRNLRAIPDLFPSLPPLPPFPSLDAPTAFSGLQDGFASPSLPFISANTTASAISTASAASTASAVSATYAVSAAASAESIASPISAFQSSLMLVAPNQLPDLVISLFILFFIISASLVLPTVFYFLINTTKISSAFTRTSRIFSKPFRTNPIPYLVPPCVPPVFSPVQLVIGLAFPLVFWTGLVRLHLSLPMILLTGFVAHVPAIFHLGLHHVDPHQ
jgi:hypothetical protein